MRCSSCNSENPEGKKFCGECGSPLIFRCATCGAENPPRFKFCGECGAPFPTQPLSPVPSFKFQDPSNPQPLTSNPQAEAEAEACFLKAIEVAQKQQAKSLELHATMSLARLWQTQGKQDEARQMLAAIYNWFTEGFDTKDLQEAKALLEELSQRSN
jgi:hypothetical protein